MGRLKIAATVAAAIAAIVAAAKSVIKFIEYIIKLRKTQAPSPA
jgi:hypothetical protein